MDEFEHLSLVHPNLALHQAASNLTLNGHVKTMIESGNDIAHFAFGQSPFPIPNCLVESLKEFAHINSYLPMKGIPELRTVLKDFHRQHDGLDLNPENFIVAPGSKELIFLIMKLFNGLILLPSPCWTNYESQALLASKQTVMLESDKDSGWKVTPATIEKALDTIDRYSKRGYKLLVFNNPGNPTGTCYTEEEITNLSVYCWKNKILVLSDEIYSRLTQSRTYHSIVKFYPEGTIMTNGFSKWASAGGWRLGYAYIPTPLQRLYDAVHSAASHTYSCAPAPMQYAFAKALRVNLPELDDYMDDCAAILNIVGDFCHRELTSVGVTGFRSEAGYYFMPDFEVIREGLATRGITTGKQFVDALLTEAQVALMESEVFLRPSTELSVRFCFVCFDGTAALESFRNRVDSSLESVSPQDEFMEKNCKTIVEGIRRLKLFVEKHKSL